MAERESGFGKAVEKGGRMGLSAIAFVAGLAALGRPDLVIAATSMLIAYAFWPKQKTPQHG